MKIAIQSLCLGILLFNTIPLCSTNCINREKPITWKEMCKVAATVSVITFSAPVYTDGVRGLLRHGATSTLIAQSRRKVAKGAFGLFAAPIIIAQIYHISKNKETA